MLPAFTIRAPWETRSNWWWVCPQTTVRSATPSRIRPSRSSGVTAVMMSSSLRGDPWPVINNWGKQMGYVPKSPGLYQRGVGFWVARRHFGQTV